VPQPVSDAELIQIGETLVAHNIKLVRPPEDLSLVMFATPGQAVTADRMPTLGMVTSPLVPERYAHLFRQGAHLHVPTVRHVPANCVDPRIKHRSRLHWWIAEQEAHDVSAHATALLLDQNGHVTETAAANFVVVHKGAVLSPPRESILGGITLQVVEELCGELGIPFREQALSLADCQSAAEAMLTSSSFAIAGVSRIGDAPIPWPGPIFKRLLDTFGKRVGVDIAAQMCAAEPT
jgi:branched-subunit amino acid aminotransferase/4-amino-4-deoxychorismate lyase